MNLTIFNFSIKDFIQKLLKDKFFRNSFIVTLFVLISSSFNWLYQGLMMRNLAKADYGLLNAIFNTSIAIGVLIGTTRIWMLNKFSYFLANKYYHQLFSLLRYFYRYIFIFFLPIIVFFLIYSQNINTALKSQYIYPVFFLLLITTLNIFIMPVTSFLYAAQRFFVASMLTFIFPVIRFVLTAYFVYSGISLFRAFSAHLVGNLIQFTGVLIVTIFLIKNLIKKNKNTLVEYDKSNIHYLSDFYSLLKISLGMISINLIFNSDLIWVRMVFSEEASGDYSAAAVISKILYFFCSNITPVFFSSVAALYHEKKSLKKIFIKGMVLSLIFAVGVYLGIYFSSIFLVNSLFQKYVNIIPLIRYYGFVWIIFVIIQIYINFFMGIEKFRILLVLLIFPVLQCALIFWIKGSIYNMVHINLGIGIVIFLILTIYLFVKRKTLLR